MLQPFEVLSTVTEVPFFSSPRMVEEVLAAERKLTLEEHLTVAAVSVEADVLPLVVVLDAEPVVDT